MSQSAARVTLLEREAVTPDAAALFGHAHAHVDHPRALDEALAAARRSDGCTIVQARVPPHDAADFYARLGPRVDAALDR